MSLTWTMAESHVDVKLLATQTEISSGQPFQLGVHLTMRDHWHTYWENPGSSGLPTEVEWELPAGLKIESLQFPVAKRFVDDADFVTYGYNDEALLIAEATYVGAAPEITIKGKVSWLECNQICLPGNQTVELKLKVGEAAVSPESALFKRFEPLMPKAFDANAPFRYKTSFQFKEASWEAHLEILPIQDQKVDVVAFFPGYHQNSEMIQSVKSGNGFTLTYEPFGDVDRQTLSLYGILEAQVNGGRAYFRLPVFPEVQAQSLSPVSGHETRPALGTGTPGFLYILVLAFFGGLILNLMPCVLPVLSIKIFSIINEAGESASRRIQFGWMYTIGILVSFAILSSFLIVAKAGGEAVGIGFQFQNPGFVIAMIALIFVMGLSFVGVFEIAAPQSQKIQGLAQKSGLLGAFYQGGLMTILSTPCTAPGLGVAYGWAVTAQSWQIFLIFEVIALGLATPYLILCYSPGLLKFLPKPGAWMESFKVVMGFLLFATVIWLMNTLMQLSGATAVTGTLTLLLFVSCAAWIHGKTFFSGPKFKGLIINIILIAAGIHLGLFKLFDVSNPTQAKKNYEENLRLKFLSNAQTGSSSDDQILEELAAKKTTPEKLAWIPYSPRALAYFRKAEKLIFLDFTAEWCATCKVNEKLVVDTKDVRSALAENEVITMKVDFTDRDPEILDFIHHFKRAGVPIYVFYPGTGEPILLPETITTRIVLDGLNEAKRRL